MEQLSSCYFCGAALDAQIEPYQIVPAALDPDSDQQSAVSLCPSCRQKLARVVETVVAATDDTDVSGIAEDVADPEPDAELIEKETADDDTARGDSTASGQPTGEAEQWEGGPDGDERKAQSAEETESENQESLGTIERTRSSHSGEGKRQQREGGQQRNGKPESGGSQQRASNQSTGRSNESADPLATDDPASGQQSADRNRAAGDAESTGQSSDQRVQAEESQQSEQTDDPAAATADDGPSLTALEYNKVMRLLQNREFPVERAEIHEVATSAYEISDREFDAIIDAAIQRGLIGEENGLLVSGD